MVYCRNCGKEMDERASFCPHCGAAAGRVCMPPPAVPYPAQKEDRTEIALVVLILVVVVVIPIILASVMYVMVMGFGTSQSSSTAALMQEGATEDGLNFTITSVSSPMSLSDVLVSLSAPSDYVYMNAGYGLTPTSNVSELNTGSYIIAYYDMDGDAQLSNGDTVTIRAAFGTLDDGMYDLVLRTMGNGALIAQTDVTLP